MAIYTLTVSEIVSALCMFSTNTHTHPTATHTHTHTTIVFLHKPGRNQVPIHSRQIVMVYGFISFRIQLLYNLDCRFSLGMDK